MTSKKPPRLGRPPASSSVETRARILEVAQESFAELGFEVTTNKYLATKAGITAGALYHYFDSKIAIYAAIYRHVTEFMFDRFEAAVAGTDTFIGKFEAMLEEAHQLDIEDPSLARFLGAMRIDISRHDEIRPALAGIPGRSRAFRQKLVDFGVKSGEIRSEDRAMVTAFMQIVLVGLTDAVSGDTKTHRIAVDSVRAVMEGRLLAPPKGTASSKRNGSSSVNGKSSSVNGKSSSVNAARVVAAAKNNGSSTPKDRSSSGKAAAVLSPANGDRSPSRRRQAR
jgi:TetR/AcrR family transcriptional regulator, repressor for uid operon